MFRKQQQNNMSFVLVLAGLLVLFHLRQLDTKVNLQHGLISQYSTVDDETYLVASRRSMESRVRAANTLARLRSMAWKLVQHLAQLYVDEPYIKSSLFRLKSKYTSRSSIVLHELDAIYHKSIAYNFQKGDSIYICLGSAERISDDETIFFVLLHELAHTMRLEYEPSVDGVTIHGPEFKMLERFLFEQASLIGLLNPSSIPGRSHCNIVIPNPADAM